MPNPNVCKHCFNAGCKCRECQGMDPECYFRNECAYDPQGKIPCYDKFYFPDRTFPLKGKVMERK